MGTQLGYRSGPQHGPTAIRKEEPHRETSSPGGQSARKSGFLMKGTSRQQQAIMEAKGWITAVHVAGILGVSQNTVYNMLSRGEIDGIRLGRIHYIRKTSIARWLKDRNPDKSPSYLPWLLMKEKSGECSVCAIKIPISRSHCSNCETVDIRVCK